MPHYLEHHESDLLYQSFIYNAITNQLVSSGGSVMIVLSINLCLV